MSALPVTSRYQVLALQVTTHSIGHLPDRAAARASILSNVQRVEAALAASMCFLAHYDGVVVRLVVLPEYSLTGSPTGGPFAAWRAKAALEMRGPEYEALGRIARTQGIYLAGNAYEADPNFEELYFQTSFVIGPSGDVVLRYRRLISLYSPTPYDVLDDYMQVYGPEALFPVADTEIGRIAAIASEEILYPEIARCHAMRGAEVFVHSTSEMGSPQATAKDVAKRARAAENIAYLVSANAAGVIGTDLPARSTTGMSKIVDYEGRVLAEATSGGESLVASATLDIAALRNRRRQSGLSNLLVRQPLQAYAECYRHAVFHVAGQLQRTPASAATDTLRSTQHEDIERLDRLGLI